MITSKPYSSTVCLTSAYLAPISYYATLYKAQRIELEQWENYTKQTYRNRCVIATANGPLTLTIPVESNGGKKCPMRDVRISDHGNWRHLHWNAFASAYRQSPFFEYYADDFHPFYEKKYPFLLDFNESLRELVCSLIGFTPTISRTTAFRRQLPQGILDLREGMCSALSPQTDPGTKVPSYYQVFSHKYGFLPNLSIADLLFNMGPESLLILQNYDLY